MYYISYEAIAQRFGFIVVFVILVFIVVGIIEWIQGLKRGK